jgi:arylsulfatase A-like enzyme
MSFSRRYFLLGALGAPALAATKKRAPLVRASVVLISTEELGAYMLGCYGNTEVRTPNIDRLAQTGVRFSMAYTNIPVPHESRTTVTKRIAAALAPAGYNCGAGSEFVDQQTPDKPFFVSVELPSPTTVIPSPKNLDRYAAAEFDSIGWNTAAPNATHKDMLRDPRGNLRKYAAAVTTVDDQLATLLDKLQQRGLAENTVVIFTTGCGFLAGRHGLWGNSLASEPPNMFEEVVRVPLIWVWPSRFPPQTVRNDVVSSVDLQATLCALAGVAAPQGAGGNYLPFVYGQRLPKKESWPDVAFSRVRNTEMARDDRCKLVLRDQGKGVGELYDLVADSGEQVNQYDNPQFGSTREHLTTRLAEWRRGAPE